MIEEFYLKVFFAMHKVRFEYANEWVTSAELHFKKLIDYSIDEIECALVEATARGHAKKGECKGACIPVLNAGVFDRPQAMADVVFQKAYLKVQEFVKTLNARGEVSEFGYFMMEKLWSIEGPFDDSESAHYFLDECFDRGELVGNYGKLMVCIAFKATIPRGSVIEQLRQRERIRDGGRLTAESIAGAVAAGLLTGD